MVSGLINCGQLPILRMATKKLLTLIILILFGWLSTVYSQDYPTVTGISITSKANGSLVSIASDKAIEDDHITGWITRNNWFYITLFMTQIDSSIIEDISYSTPVRNIDVIQSGESAQIAVQISRKIDYFNIDNFPEKSTLQFSLMYPLEEVAAVLESSAPAESPKTPTYTKQSLGYQRVKTALYLIGSAFTVAGIVDVDANDDGAHWEFPTGIGIITGTYLFDKYLYPLLVENE